jgi:hypothetical protein
MSADIANTTLASAPYFDDFNEDKKFHRVLFRPSYPVQARELTQLQSILQNQIERFGDSVYKTGSIIKGCAPTVISDANYFVVPDAFDVANTSYENAIAYGAITGIQARILKGISGFVASTSPPKFIVKYTTVGTNGATQFLEDETINIYDAGQSYIGQYKFTVASNTGFVANSRIRGQTSDARGYISSIVGSNLTITDTRGDFVQGETIELLSNTAVTTITNNIILDFSTANNITGAELANTVVANSTTANSKYTPTGDAYAVSVSEGVVYQKGFFIKTDQQVLILNSSAGGPSAANNILVGIETAESVIDEFADSSLYDNSGNISNEAAPGAHRLKLDTTFVKYDKASTPDEEIFFALGEFGSNNILRWNTTSLAGRVGDELAQRTYDESGHYTVNDFIISTKPASNTEQFEYLINVPLGGTKAYVRGNAIAFNSEQYFTSRRGTDTESPIQQIVSMTYGNYVNAQEVRGYFPADESAPVNLYDTFQNAITSAFNSSSAPVGNIVGTANIRNIVYDEGGDAKGMPDAKYKVYLFNIKMNSNKSFTDDVRSIVYSVDTNKKAFADIAVSDEFFSVTNVAIQNAGTNYVTGDTVVVNGGSGESVKIVLTANTSTGVVTGTSIADSGRYDILPSANASAILSTSGGTGSGLTVSLNYDGEVESELKESSYSPLIFGLSNRAVKNLKDANNDSDTRFYYNLEVNTAISNTGSITVSIPDGGSFFGFSDSSDASENKIDLILTGDSLETANLSGTVNAAATNVLTGTSTRFSLDFMPGETIRFNSTNNLIVSITSNTSMTLAAPVTVSSNTYTRVHHKGSAISLENSNRSINVDSGLQTLTVDLNVSNNDILYAFGGTKEVKARVYARKVNARPIAKTVKRNQKVRFYNGTLTGTITSSNNNVTGSSTTFDADIKVGNYIRANGQTRKVTAKSSNTALTIDTAFNPDVAGANTFEIVHPYGFNMGVPDVFKINRVSKTGSANDDVNSIGSGILNFFTVDYGQRDTHYDHAVLYPKSTASISNTYLIVDFDCFEANAAIGKGFFSVESYSVNDAIGADTSTSIKTWEIPTFYSQARQRDFDLRDAIDFRPYRANTANVTANSEIATLNPPPTTSFNSATTDYNPFPGQNFECNLTYYLPRRDALVLTSKGEFRVIEGEASLQPRTPNADSETQMVVATTHVPAYPSLTTVEAKDIKNYPYTMKVSPTVNKRFTMKDISAIEQRVSSLEYFTTLTRLEQKVTQLNIPNADGIDRFKNGIFVDPFDNHNLARLNDPEHQIVIDTLNGVGRPKISIETVKLELDNANGNSKTIIRDSANNIAYNKDFLTVDYVPNTVFLEQSFATREIPIDSDDRFLYGTVDLDKEIFSDVEQFRTYPNREYGAAYDSYETNTNYTVELIYPNSRTVKILARGLKPNAKHYIGVDGVDYSVKAVQGFIQIGADEIAENVVADGTEGQDLYADSNGRLYAIINLPGTIGIGSHIVTVSDVIASAISNGLCSSRALGSFVVNSVDTISDYPPEPQPPIPKVGTIVADFDVVGDLVVIEGTTHSLSFLDKTNRGIIPPGGSILETPVSWEWTFVQCSTGCVDSSSATSALQNPEDIVYTFYTPIETVYVKLKVTGSGGTVSEIIKPVQLTKYQDNTAGLRLTIYNQLPGSDNNFYASGGSILKAVSYLHLIFRADMTSNRVSGGRCKIAITGNKSGITYSGTNFTATNVGTTEITTNDGKDNGGREIGLRWKGANVQETSITIVATYENAAGQVLDTLTKTISWSPSGTLAPCKPCGAGQLEITPINGADPCSTPEVNIRPIGDVLTYKVC